MRRTLAQVYGSGCVVVVKRRAVSLLDPPPTDCAPSRVVRATAKHVTLIERYEGKQRPLYLSVSVSAAALSNINQSSQPCPFTTHSLSPYSCQPARCLCLLSAGELLTLSPQGCRRAIQFRATLASAPKKVGSLHRTSHPPQSVPRDIPNPAFVNTNPHRSVLSPSSLPSTYSSQPPSNCHNDDRSKSLPLPSTSLRCTAVPLPLHALLRLSTAFARGSHAGAISHERLLTVFPF
jgi:hypothetical protein